MVVKKRKLTPARRRARRRGLEQRQALLVIGAGEPRAELRALNDGSLAIVDWDHVGTGRHGDHGEGERRARRRVERRMERSFTSKPPVHGTIVRGEAR